MLTLPMNAATHAAQGDGHDAIGMPDDATLRDVVEAVNRALLPASGVAFRVDEDTGHAIVRVIDSITAEVIRQIPFEELLAIADAIDGNHARLAHAGG